MMSTSEYIISLLNKVLQKESLSALEEQSLKEWFASNRPDDALLADPQWNQELVDYLAFVQNNHELNQGLSEFNLRAGFDQNNSLEREQSSTVFVRPVHRVHFLRKWGWAAAIILALGTGAYLYTTTQKEKPILSQQQSKTSDIAPGSNKAILTLSDGKTIVLDSAANGAIAQQGNSSIIKKSDGEIIYDLKGLSQGDVMMNTMTTPRGGQYQLVLPDGSRVWLNAASSVTYPAAFVAKERKIKITGEAYLEVAKNKVQPFIVDVNGKSTIEVLGTSFNINSYADDGNIKTTLIEGSVKVNSSTILKPGQQAVVSIGNQKDIKVNSADIEQTLAWKKGLFNFKGIRLSSMLRQLERWYDIKIEFTGKSQDVIMNGEMDRGVRLSGIFQFFKDYGFDTRLEGRTLIISE